ncbi:hypothetical protein [Actinomycetospora sp.]|uniref:hypothetical protein n=1 Tax=Actinomycetospora sp. TaxID=1872135 RepID=UPI002F403A4D
MGGLVGGMQVDVDVVERRDEPALVVRRVDDDRGDGDEEGEHPDRDHAAVGSAPPVGVEVIPVWVIPCHIRARRFVTEARIGHRLTPGHDTFLLATPPPAVTRSQ